MLIMQDITFLGSVLHDSHFKISFQSQIRSVYYHKIVICEQLHLFPRVKTGIHLGFRSNVTDISIYDVLNLILIFY